MERKDKSDKLKLNKTKVMRGSKRMPKEMEKNESMIEKCAYENG